MAKQDTVYSLFGMETPQEAIARQFKESFAYTPGTSGYSRLGAGLGQALGVAFAPQSARVQRAKEGERILRSVDQAEAAREIAQEGIMRQQQDQRNRQVDAIAGTETAGTTSIFDLPDQKTDLEKTYDSAIKQADLYDKYAEALSAGNFTREAENARTQALTKRMEALKFKTEIEKAAKPKAKSYKEIKKQDEIITYELNPNGSLGKIVATAPRHKPTDAAAIAKALYQGTQEQVIDKEMIKYYSDSYAEQNKAVESARKSYANLDKMEALLDSGILSGKFAELELATKQALVDAGVIDDVKVGNTEKFVQIAARQTIALLASGVFGTAQSITDNDRNFAEKLAGGKITVTEDTLRTLLDINRYYSNLAFEMQRDTVRQARDAFSDNKRINKIFQPAYRNGQKFETQQYGTIVWDQRRRRWTDEDGNLIERSE